MVLYGAENWTLRTAGCIPLKYIYNVHKRIVERGRKAVGGGTIKYPILSKRFFVWNKIWIPRLFYRQTDLISKQHCVWVCVCVCVCKFPAIRLSL